MTLPRISDVLREMLMWVLLVPFLLLAFVMATGSLMMVWLAEEES